MAIQIPNAGTGNGATGDNEFVLWTKVINNFSDQTHAASRLVGTAAGQIPLAQDTFKAAMSVATNISKNNDSSFNANDCDVGVRYLLKNTSINMPPEVGEYLVVTTYGFQSQLVQTAIHKFNNTFWIRCMSGSSWLPWKNSSSNPLSYSVTTAAGANVVVTTDGTLQRSTSSERYKNILASLELDDARYADAMALKPIVYRSTADADNPSYHYYSFSAEELGAYDPAFTLWRDTEMVTDVDGNISEQPLAERQAEGININALLAMGHAIAIKQDKLIKALEARIEILEAK